MLQCWKGVGDCFQFLLSGPRAPASAPNTQDAELSAYQPNRCDVVDFPTENKSVKAASDLAEAITADTLVERFDTGPFSDFSAK